ncbi:glycosyl transferase family 2 [Actinomyces oris]|uniref:glycosyltransferase family 2 protein n=1 Tax=Actinomyces oris TaxID=544580 RepID=UPI00094C81BA|nr:glycosyltransferase family A protein [Actinomyces oris]OLO66722.1 glycosyl transferase family 2 [Actinomyces oris]
MAGPATQSPRVTVVTRTRNRPLMLKRAVQSVGAQSFQDLELVIVNDAGSTEPVESALASAPEWLRERTTVVTNETSHGREAALEDGLAASSCEFFAIHDDDDSWEPSFLAACVAHLDEHPEHGAVATRCDVVDEMVTEEGLVERGHWVMTKDGESWTLIDTMVANYVPPISQLIRREVADRIGHWDGNLLTQADWDFNLRLLATSPVGFINGEPLAHWHHRDSTDGTMGNSVVVDAVHHRTDNLAIRDRYARLSLEGAGTEASVSHSAPAAPGNLGLLLVSAEYYHRLEERLHQHEEHLREHEKKLDQQNAYLTQSIAQLHEDMHSLRFTIGDLHDSIRHVLMQLHETKGKIDHLEATVKPFFRTVAQGVKRIRRG